MKDIPGHKQGDLLCRTICDGGVPRYRARRSPDRVQGQQTTERPPVDKDPYQDRLSGINQADTANRPRPRTVVGEPHHWKSPTAEGTQN